MTGKRKEEPKARSTRNRIPVCPNKLVDIAGIK